MTAPAAPAASVAVVGATFQCPLPCSAGDAVSAAQRTQLGSWDNVLLSRGTEQLQPGDALEAVEYALTSYDAFGNSAIRIPKTEWRGITLQQLQEIVNFIDKHAHLWVETHSESPDFGLPLEAQDEMSDNPRSTSFYRAMKLSVGVVLILDKGASPFKRIWCCFEESIAVQERNTGTPLLLDVAATDSSNEAHVITDGLAAAEERQIPLLGFLAKSLREVKFPTLLAREGLRVNIAQANAFNEDDKTRILKSIRRPQARTKELLVPEEAPLQDDPCSAVNKALAAHFALALWFGFVAQGPQGSQGHATSDLLRYSDLLEALAADSSRQMVELSFTGCRGFTDDSLQQLLRHLPRHLRVLRLDLGFSGIESWDFPEEMPSLEELTLRFTGSILANASGLARMLDTEHGLAKSLRSLQLWFSNLPHRCEKYGTGVYVTATVLDEEYERELQVEKEVEKEVEKQLPSVKPVSEVDWDLSKLPSAKSIKDLPSKVLTLPRIFASTIALKGIHFPPQQIFATENFHQTILGHQTQNLDDYLRPVDAVILFLESKELLLLSEREADLALEAFWTSKSQRNVFTNWALWRNSFSLEIPGLLPAGPGSGSCPMLQDASALVSIQAFMGDTRFNEEAQKKELQDLVNHVERECGDARFIKEFVNVRGMMHRFERSDLARILNSR